MGDSAKTKEELISELNGLRERVKDLEFKESRGRYLEDVLRASQSRLKYLLTYSNAMIYSAKTQLDRHNFSLHSINFVSENIKQVLGYEPQEISNVPTAWVDRIHKDDIAVIEYAARVLFKSGHYTSEYRFQDKNGAWRWLHDEMRLISDDRHQPLEVIGVCFDITKRKHMEEELRLLSVTDQLTGLYNRRGFIAFAEQQLKLTSRRKRGVLLFFADLDDMKAINDNFGHEIGDKALVEAAAILRETFRETDIIARIGGDEFAIMTIDSPRVTSDLLVSRLQDRISEHNARHENPFLISMSIGIATSDKKCSLDELMSIADGRMYENKKKKNP